ncbi:MAG: amino acid permease, partial [Malacoplasma sp.]
NNGLNNSMGSFVPSTGDANATMATISQLVIFVSFILSYLGVEASASQIKNLKNPGKNYPRVMIILVCLAIGFSSIAGVFIGIATRVGASSGSAQLSFTGGIIQAFLIMLSDTMGHEAAMGLTRFVAFLMGAAVIAQISSWIVGPSKAMQVAAENNLLPKIFAKTNKYDVPIYMILLQSCFVLMWCVVIIFGMMGGLGVNSTNGDNGSNVGFLGAMQLTTLVYLLAYFVLMIAYIKFALAKPGVYETEFVLLKKKSYKMIFVSLGLITNLFAFIVALFPQSSDTSTYGIYYGIIFGLLIPTVAMPFIIFYFMNKKYKISDDNLTLNLNK